MFAITLSFLLLIWSTDTAAYAVGSTCGKRPFFPALSPKKTWEGYLGGIAGALVVGIALRVLALEWMPWYLWIPIVLVCGAISPFGDLAESALKRAACVKDSGTFFPGHGGMLDRLDSIIVSAPLVLACLLLI
jgi:phosphatidate cytidylyltransferase